MSIMTSLPRTLNLQIVYTLQPNPTKNFRDRLLFHSLKFFVAFDQQHASKSKCIDAELFSSDLKGMRFSSSRDQVQVIEGQYHIVRWFSSWVIWVMSDSGYNEIQKLHEGTRELPF